MGSLSHARSSRRVFRVGAAAAVGAPGHGSRRVGVRRVEVVDVLAPVLLLLDYYASGVSCKKKVENLTRHTFFESCFRKANNTKGYQLRAYVHGGHEIDITVERNSMN